MGGLQYERACTFARLCNGDFHCHSRQNKTRISLQPPTQSTLPRLGWLSGETCTEGRDNEDKYDNQF